MNWTQLRSPRTRLASRTAVRMAKPSKQMATPNTATATSGEASSSGCVILW